MVSLPIHRRDWNLYFQLELLKTFSKLYRRPKHPRYVYAFFAVLNINIILNNPLSIGRHLFYLQRGIYFIFSTAIILFRARHLFYYSAAFLLFIARQLFYLIARTLSFLKHGIYFIYSAAFPIHKIPLKPLSK